MLSTARGFLTRPTGPPPVLTEPTGSLFNDGFESETSSAFTGVNWNGKTEASSSTATLETTTPLVGAKSMLYTHATNGSAYVIKTFARSEAYIQFKVKIHSLPAGGVAFGTAQILTLVGGWGQVFLGYGATPSNGLQVRLRGGTPTQDVTAPTYYLAGTTLRIEMHYRAGGGTDATEAWVDGSRIATFATSDPGSITSFRLGPTGISAGGYSAGTQLLFDDVKVSASYIGLPT